MSNSSERTTAERITLIVSLVILTATFSLAGWATVRTGDTLPLIEVETHMDQMRSTGSRYYVPITVTNEGGLTAQDVIVTGELDTGEDQPETAEITITFLAGGESEHAELIFTSDPVAGDLTVGPTSFVEP